MRIRPVLFLLLISSLAAADWPQFRDGSSAGVSNDTPVTGALGQYLHHLAPLMAKSIC